EKIDYAILKDGVPGILIECKHHEEVLDVHQGQLIRYFNISPAKFGILTNGVVYRFYTDTTEPNKMDEEPFLEFDITTIRDSQIEDLKRFQKSQFSIDIDNVMSAAVEMKYLGAIKKGIAAEMQSPTEDFVKMMTRRVYNGNATAKVIEQFTGIVKKACKQYVSELITDRLNTALTQEKQQDQGSQPDQAPQENAPSNEEAEVVDTTTEEKEAYIIVRSIVKQVAPFERIYIRDAKSYCAVLYDDNNRKPVCRMYFNGDKKKYLATFDADKKEAKHEIQSLEDIFQYSDLLVQTVKRYTCPVPPRADDASQLEQGKEGPQPWC
ncbi:MAG: restriction endonuclease, partial [Clostridia bacterium]|nr:restriction endonuclease [Clostridia bacterium]